MSDLPDALRETIRKLQPTGQAGFEGLMAAVLTELTKRSFAIARSGSQHGKDGASAFDGVIAFEGKLYDGAVPLDQVLSKIAQMAEDPESKTELWILGSTGPISSQHIKTTQGVARRFGIGAQVLAWPTTGLSEFATLLAMAPDVSAKFLAANSDAPECEVLYQLNLVRSHPQFIDRCAELRLSLEQPSMAPAYALDDNIAWLSKTFSSKSRARAEFGQALCPRDPSNCGVLDRLALRSQLASAIFSPLDGSITAILGADGNGKSWAFADAWMTHPSKPLTVVLVPEDAPLAISSESLTDLLIKKLLTQTGEVTSDESIGRWRKHFDRWRRNTHPDGPRLIIYVDGLNQREAYDWLRFMDAMSDLAANIGGKLVFSCRPSFYREYLKNRIISPTLECNVPEWSEGELEQLLQSIGTSISDLDSSVVRSLRNPRIFSVAVMLLTDEKISAFRELSVNWLLFEHIRTGAAVSEPVLPPSRFVTKVRDHADRIVSRLREKQTDDIVVFDMTNASLSDRFGITSAGRFFELLPEDTSKYKLKEEGLSLALGLALVNSARTAQRNGRNCGDALAHILDPIAALDRTGDVLIGAILAAILEEAPDEVVVALVRSFIGLQNIDPARYEEFRALLRRSPSAFLIALEEMELEGTMFTNRSWLTRAIEDSREISEVAEPLDAAIHRWLSLYSTATDRSVATPNVPEHAERREKELIEKASELTRKAESFSQAERDAFSSMTCTGDGDYNRLNLIAFELLVGQTLAKHVVGLRNWCLAASFNGGYRSPHNDFLQLVRFNLVDWDATREGLLNEARLLREPSISITGKWALASLLSATGDSDDAQEAEQVIDKLTQDHETIERWRRVEDYCATDPCDPRSERPGNIDQTAQQFADIDVSVLRKMPVQGQGDFFFDDARTGLARFQVDQAIGTMRRFADDVLGRSKADFRSAAFFLEEHTAALDRSYASPFIAKASAVAQEILDEERDTNNEGWVSAQYALLIAFPHLTGDAQFDAFMAHPQDVTFIRDLCGLFLPCDPAKLEKALEQAIAQQDEVKQFRSLAFAEHSGTRLTPKFLQLASLCIDASHPHIRLSALALIRTLADAELLKALSESGWSAARLDAIKHGPEITYGSEALVNASKLGMLPMSECLERIDLSAYRILVRHFGAAAAVAVSERLETSIRKAANYRIEGSQPRLELRIDDTSWSPLIHISDKPGATPPQGMLTGDAWHEREQLNKQLAEQFEQSLVEAGSQIILQFVTDDLLKGVYEATPATVDNWVNFFLSLDQNALNNVHNVALVVARVISGRDSAKSVALFKRLANGSPPVRIRLAHNLLSLEAISVWGAAVSSEMRELQFARLDRCRNDYDLSMEILAALNMKREGTLSDYVLDRCQRSEAAHRARAVMVAGLSPASGWALQTIVQFENACGFLHHAYEAAKYAMDRHQWSEHWLAIQLLWFGVTGAIRCALAAPVTTARCS